MKSMAVFLGARDAKRALYKNAVKDLSNALANHGLGVVYGGSNTGLMKQLADHSLAAGTTVIGVSVTSLAHHEAPHSGLTELHIVDNMHQRKSMMAKLADGFIAVPGGVGTLEELFEIYTWARLGFHHKPIGLLNVHGYYDALLDFLDHSVKEGFLDASGRQLLHVDQDPHELINKMLRDHKAGT